MAHRSKGVLAMTRYGVVTSVLVAAACNSYNPPTSVAPKTVLPVAASFDRTWEATIDVMAEQNLPIQSLEKASGLIATAPLTVSRDRGREWADCGSLRVWNTKYAPRAAVFNVLVRGDSVESRVQINIRFVTEVEYKSTGTRGSADCISSGVFEKELAAAIRARVESKGR